MEQVDLVRQLDALFDVAEFDESEAWDFALNEADRAVLQRYAAPAFLDGTWNGLMLDNAREVERVYLAVFPSRPVLDMAIAREIDRRAPGAIIFTHHLVAYDPAQGFSAIPEAQLADLQEQKISLYVCHGPLDCHAEISTGEALARALRLHDLNRFAFYINGYTGVWGSVKSAPFHAFAERLATVCEMRSLRYDQVCHNGHMVQKVAIVPGGGDDPDLINEAQELGCDTYVTGEWWPYRDGEWAAQQRIRLSELIPCLSMNLLGSSHYSSELVVLRDQMLGWFKDLGIDTQLLREPSEAPAG
ncbi:MAG: Nif3-like dinuclear metal center hexameric protein [Anaerolineae bacterium]